MKKGFTFAEIIIVLSIVGIIAEMTIPTIVKDIQEKTLKTAWKKNFSVLSSATTEILQDNGGTFKGAFPSNYYDGARWFAEQYMSKMQYIKYCWHLSYPDQRCWVKDEAGNAVLEKYLYGSQTFNPNIGGYPGIILKDGSFLLFHTYNDTNCEHYTPYIVCGDILVDVNGQKKPNTLGKDIFQLRILPNKIEPYGKQGDGYNPTTTCVEGSTLTSNTGYGCAAKYLYSD